MDDGETPTADPARLRKYIERNIMRFVNLHTYVDCEAIRVWITLKLGSLLSFMIRNAFL